MFGVFSGSRFSPIVLDLGSDGVKMLQMKRVGSTVRVSAGGQWRYPAAAGADPLQRRELAVQAVREMLRAGGCHGRRVTSALSSAELHIKNVRLPHMPAQQLEQAILWEAKERFPFDVEPDRIRHLHAGQVRQGAELRDEIIMLAVPAETMERHLEMLGQMGLRPEHVDPEPIALFRGFERFLKRSSDEDAVTVLVDLGRRATRVVVARGRRVVFIKSIDIGGQKLIQAVAKQLGISEQEAGELRVRIMRESHGGTAPGDSAEGSGRDRANVEWTVHDALRGEVEALAKEIALCLRYCSVTFRGLRPDRVTLTGGEAYDPAVRNLLQENLGIECVLGQPLKGIDVSDVDFENDRRATLAEWAVCAGLAARETRMMPYALEGKNARDRLPA